jgi:hypothetical protein
MGELIYIKCVHCVILVHFVLSAEKIVLLLLQSIFLLCYLVNKANLVHNFSWYVYFFSLHVSGDYVPIIRRNNCIYATLGTCHSETSEMCDLTML